MLLSLVKSLHIEFKLFNIDFLEVKLISFSLKFNSFSKIVNSVFIVSEIELIVLEKKPFKFFNETSWFKSVSDEIKAEIDSACIKSILLFKKALYENSPGAAFLTPLANKDSRINCGIRFHFFYNL